MAVPAGAPSPPPCASSASRSSLVNALLECKRDFDANAPLVRVMPALVRRCPTAYGGLGLRDLGSVMFAAMRKTKISELLQAADDVEPHAVFAPAVAYDRLIRGHGDAAGIAGLAGGIAATAIVPYPPGI